MQDINTGYMVPIEKDNKEQIEAITMTTHDSENFNADEIAQAAEKKGFCVLAVGEMVDINGGNFKILSIGKKEVIFECPENVKELKLKPYQRLKIKNGNFLIKSFGTSRLIAMGVPGLRTLDQQIIDDARKAEIEAIRKKDEKTEDNKK